MRTPRTDSLATHCGVYTVSGAHKRLVTTGRCAVFALTMAGFVSSAAQAQDTIVIGGGGPRGEAITINLDALDDERLSRIGSRGEEEDEAAEADTGERALRFPPLEPPRSRLLTGAQGSTGEEAVDRTPPPPPEAPSTLALSAPQPPGPRPESEAAKAAAAQAPSVPAPQARPEAAIAETVAKRGAPPPASKPEPQVVSLPAAAPPPAAKPAAPNPEPAGPKPASRKPENAPLPGDKPSESRAPANGVSPTNGLSGKLAADTPDSGEPRLQSASVADAPATDPSAPRPEAAPDEAASHEAASDETAQPAPESEAAPAPGDDQRAALPPAGDLPASGEVRLLFDAETAELGEAARERLLALAEEMADAPQSRIQLKAYAEGTEETASRARRLSLSRALAVRSFLIDEGIRSTRIDVRALGGAAENGPPDRVDIAPARR